MSANAAALHSAVYEGVVRHHRLGTRPHAFAYRMAQVYLDLDEIDRVFAGRWLWSRDARNVAEFRRSDYLGPADVPLAEAVRRRVAQHTGMRPAGPVRLLTHLRYAGYVFNPVSFYYCYAADGSALSAIVAEITNTPWGERHAYVLPAESARRPAGEWEWTFPKTFHVSPFVGLKRDYLWRFTTPGERLRVHMSVLHDGRPEFKAMLDLERRPIDGRHLARVLWRHPLMTAQVIGAIYWQALRLWLKGTPAHDHPKTFRGTS
ncbi:MAG TPA: DUF1365 domain-containing protein [Steroidobacteraceae bacterium]|nr:DUF1365 domain-containing protein [Steroidobacteraceae bacterium]